MDKPAITIAYDMDSETYILEATSYGRTTPAGTRLFRAPPHPDINFRHTEREAADKDAATLRAYIDLTWIKPPNKKKQREFVA